MLKESVQKIIRDIYPMHMPGHKRNPAFLHDYSRLDLTEIEGTDDLHAPNGIILEAQRRTAALFGAKRTFYLTGGSTCGVLAALTAVTKPGDTVLVARNCHKSVYHALSVGGLNARFLFPAINQTAGVYGQIEPQAVKAALAAGGVKAVVLTSPTYEGMVSDIKTIAEVVHKAGALLIVDGAHGAHLGFSDALPASARSLGADIVIESAHKTLPCMTGAALLHLCSDRVDPVRVAEMLAVFLTSSPSYPLLYSLDDMTTLLTEQKQPLFAAYTARLDRFYENMKALTHLRLYRGEGAFAADRGKLSILCDRTNINGFALKKRLLNDYKIACEMALPGSVLAMTSIADTDEGFDRLADALFSIDATLSDGKTEKIAYPDEVQTALTIRDALSAPYELVAAKAAVGKVSAEYVLAYPPGSPLIAPGEIITEKALAAASALKQAGAEVISSSGRFPDEIRTIKYDTVC